MSDIDKEDYKNEQELLRPQDVSYATLEQDLKKRKKKKLIKGLIISILLIAVILGISIPLALTSNSKNNDEKDPVTPPPGPTPATDPFQYQEFNDYQLDTIDQSVWKAQFILKSTSQNQARINNELKKSFMRLEKKQIYTNKDYKPVDPKDIPDSYMINEWANKLQFNIDMIDNYQARILIQDTENMGKHRVHDDVFKRPTFSWEARLTQIMFQQKSNPFEFSFGNIYTKETIISTEKRKFLVSEKFSELGFVLPTQRCFGLGQRNGKFQLQHGSYSLWSRFRETGLPQDQYLGGTNGNHIHPFILCQTKSKDFFGMFFASNAPQVFEVIQFPGDERMVLNYITLGGPIEIYTIMRGKAQEIISKYHALIGYSMMPPYYALGHYQASNSYSSMEDIKKVFSGYAALEIPLEGVFIDQYNSEPHSSFTIDEERYKDLANYLKEIHSNNQHAIFTISTAFSNSSDIYQKAKDQCLIMSVRQKGSPVITILDSTYVAYLDPFNEQAKTFLKGFIPDFITKVGNIDGIQLLDTFLSSHIKGEVLAHQNILMQESQLTEETIGNYEPYMINKDLKHLYDLPFTPAYKLFGDLDNMTIPISALQGGGNIEKVDSLYVHNGNAHKTIQIIQEILIDPSIYQEQTGKRPFILNDATWAGSGAYGAGIITDLQRTWENLPNIINQAISMSMYGVSNTMVDTCGSIGPFDEELCARWIQIASFMPLYRNYFNSTYLDSDSNSQIKGDSSEPYNFKNEEFIKTYKLSSQRRLQFSRYIYSSMYQVYREGGSLIKPLFFDFPNDDKTLDQIEKTFMLGDAIKVSPVLQKGLKDEDQYQSYFPQGIWVDLNDPTFVFNASIGGEDFLLNASLKYPNIHLKGGKIIPYQKNIENYQQTKDFETKLRMSFKIARDQAGKYAEGFILIDDGISNMSFYNNEYTYWKLRYAEKSINFWVQYGDFNYEPPQGYQIHYLEDIDIMNAEDLEDTDFACYLGRNFNPINLDIKYNHFTKTLNLSPTKINPDVQFKDIGLIKFGDSRKEPNLCDVSSYTYLSASKSIENHKWVYNITNKQGSDLFYPLVVEFTQLDDKGTINVEITSKVDYDSGKKILYRVPEEVFDLKQFPTGNLKTNLSDYLSVQENPFSYQILKRINDSSQQVLWSSDPKRMYFSDYLIFDSGIFSMNTDNDKPLLGMGERAGSLFYKNETGGIHSRYTFDQANPIDDGLPPGRNMYGYQPLYAYQTPSTDWVGVFDLSSYATDYVVYTDIGNSQSQIHKYTIGGTINKFFFVGQKPDDIIKTYQKLVGNPTVPPLWAFGWQQCRFGWVTEEDWWNVYLNYTKADLPLDTMWADIDYMDDYKLFTISQQSYKNLPDKVEVLKEKGITFVPIMDAGVAVRENQGYSVLDNGLKKEVFIQRADQQAPLTAGVWCGNAYFPDFFNPAAVEWWSESFENLYKIQNLQFDGIWLDENEATNFCNGYCINEERPSNSLRNKPFYVPGWRDLEDKALGVDGYHPTIDRHEYDVHNLFPLMQAKATADYLKSLNKRPYILTRGNYPGIGKYAHHWMGDNWSTQEYMALSVDGIYSYNLFGLPFMGSDICGFNGDAQNEVCTRWHILGSLYPFARNHNQNATKSQEPYRFTDQIPNKNYTYVDVIRSALRTRYSYIRYYYSAFHQIGTFGGSFFKPIFYEYPNNPLSYQDIQNNILLGEALKVSIDTQNMNFTNDLSKDFYFPQDTWCQILPKIVSPAAGCIVSTGQKKGGYLNLKANLEDYYIHLRIGYIIPYQEAMETKVSKTKDLEDIHTDLYILSYLSNQPLDLQTSSNEGVARGYIYFDDGVSLKQDIARFDLYLVKLSSNNFAFEVQNVGQKKKAFGLTQDKIGTINILWASKSGIAKIKKAQLTTIESEVHEVQIMYNSTIDVLQVIVKDYTFWDIQKIDLLH